MNLLKSTGIIGGMTLISRIFGFVRDMMLSRLLGGSAMGDAWQIAFQLPNIFRRLFAEGAFSAAFVPLFNRHMAEDGARDHIDALTPLSPEPGKSAAELVRHPTDGQLLRQCACMLSLLCMHDIV